MFDLKKSSLVVMCLMSSWLHAEDTTQEAVLHTKLKHQFVCIGNHKNVLIYIDEFAPEKSWSVSIPKGSRDIELIDGERLLVSHGNGASEYRLSDGTSLPWKVSGFQKVQSARRLASGHTALLTQRGLLITVDEKGEELTRSQIKVAGIKGAKLDFRLMRQSNDGSWVIGSKLPRAVLVVSPQGKLLQQYKLPGKGYKAMERENGNWLSSSGDESKVLELSPAGEIVSFFGGKEAHPQQNLDFNSGWDQAPNGNVVMCNWLGHKKHNTAAHLLEFDSSNQLVWKWEDHELVKQVTNCLMIK